MKTSTRVAYVSLVSCVAALAAVGIGAIVLVILGADVVQTYKVILTEPLKDLFGITEVLVRAVPLILVALGIAISFRAGILNIGAEGQIQMGIVSATAVALALPNVPKGILVPLVLCQVLQAERCGLRSRGISGQSSASTKFCLP